MSSTDAGSGIGGALWPEMVSGMWGPYDSQWENDETAA